MHVPEQRDELVYQVGVPPMTVSVWPSVPIANLDSKLEDVAYSRSPIE